MYPPCADCNGSGFAYCCEGLINDELTQGVTEMPTRIDYWHDKETPENTGWYICRYGTVADMLANSPEDNIGPYETRQEAMRVLAEADERKERKANPYDPARDPTPASLDAGIPTDADDFDEADEASPGESIQLELQQAQELRDVPTEVQGD